jgi:hypothetical protein
LAIRFEVGDGAQAADNDLRAFFMDEVHEQRVEADDFDIRQVAEDLGGHLDTVGEGKARLLGRAFGNGQDQFVDAEAAALAADATPGEAAPDESAETEE